MTLRLAYLKKKKEKEVEVKNDNYNIEKEIEIAWEKDKEFYIAYGKTKEDLKKFFYQYTNKTLLQNSLKKK